jgi:hypothetical protein
MIDNKTLILSEFESLKGQFVITEMNQVQRLVAIGEDQMDYYWILYDGRCFIWQSCVGGVIQLKGKIDGIDYQRLVRTAKLNHLDQPTLWGSQGETSDLTIALNVAHKFELEKPAPGHKFLTPICWDLN